MPLLLFTLLCRKTVKDNHVLTERASVTAVSAHELQGSARGPILLPEHAEY